MSIEMGILNVYNEQFNKKELESDLKIQVMDFYCISHEAYPPHSLKGDSCGSWVGNSRRGGCCGSHPNTRAEGGSGDPICCIKQRHGIVHRARSQKRALRIGEIARPVRQRN